MQPNLTRQSKTKGLSNGGRRRLMLAYGLGDAGTGLAATQLGTHLFLFFTCAAGLPAFIAGSLLMVIKIWDAINDPVIGWLSDHTKSRWGPRLPWMIGAAAPLGISLSAIWWIPPGDITTKTIYYIGIAILLMTAYTSVNLPYAALSTEITEETSIRTRLNAARFTGSILAGLSGLAVAALLLSDGNNNENYFLMGRITGTIATLTTLLSCIGLAPFTKKARKPLSKAEPILKQINRIRKNKLFHKIIYLYLLLWCGLQLMQTAALMYLQQVMRVPAETSFWMLIPFQVSALIGLQYWSFYSNKYSRLKALFKGSYIWISSCLLILVLPPINNGISPTSLLLFDSFDSFKMIILLITISLLGFGASTAYLIPWSLLPDAIDIDPEKPAGVYTAWMVFIQKIGIGISVFLFGTLLSLSGYKSIACMALSGPLEQPDSAITTIRLSMGLIPALLVVIGLLIIKSWVDIKPNYKTKTS